MDKLKKYFFDNFEQFFVFILLITVVIINYFISHKIAFLNFYFLPVILAGYLLNRRKAVFGAFLCIILIVTYTILYPEHFIINNTRVDLYIHIAAWGGFLILAGAIVGKLHEKLKSEIDESNNLNKQLLQQQKELDNANIALKDYNDNLELKVKNRTEELEKSKSAIETLKSKVEDALYSTMDSTVAKLIIEGRLRNEKRKVSVMFSDLVGFTGYSENRSPELLVRDLNRYLNDMEPILLDYRGHIDKYLGDGIMCEFGATIDYENYQLLAVLAALKMQQKMANSDYPWQMRIGIASGTAIIGLIGSRRQSFTTIGDVVNVASRLEASCLPGSILVDASTLEGIRNFVIFRLKKDLSKSGEADTNIEFEIEELHQKLENAKNNIEKGSIYYHLGKLYISSGENNKALDCFEKGLKISPDNIELKVAFAEATITKDEEKKIGIKGRKQPVAAYEILGLKDVLLDRDKIPDSFYEKYHYANDLIQIPDDVILPVEALDGCIGHSSVVALLSYAIASELGISEKEKTEILHAGFVADIGKDIIPHHLLNRNSRSLSDNDRKEIQKHPVEGERTLKKMGYDSKLLLEIVRHSHENYNGSGYPDGLMKEEIPVGSRIIAVADTYDALTSWRPYSEKWDRNAALDELHRSMEMGLFDPQVVEILIRLIDN